MIKEVIVVEGKCDIAAVRRAVDADCIATGGYSMLKGSLSYIKAAYIKRGIIIFTDPDSAGERIRRYLAKRFPLAKHAFLDKEQARGKDDIGVECASTAAIRAALALVHCGVKERENSFSVRDIALFGLTGTSGSGSKRLLCCNLLGLGWCNAKQFVERLNGFGVTREQLEQAVSEAEKEINRRAENGEGE